ncbi:MAG TPA: hypothetical protein VK517_16255, partial [Cyclobacteriaceae bacterium]|nr:hypothetical protein [Cyclobacteriaceae bacterium]
YIGRKSNWRIIQVPSGTTYWNLGRASSNPPGVAKTQICYTVNASKYLENKADTFIYVAKLIGRNTSVAKI